MEKSYFRLSITVLTVYIMSPSISCTSIKYFMSSSWWLYLRGNGEIVVGKFLVFDNYLKE